MQMIYCYQVLFDTELHKLLCFRDANTLQIFLYSTFETFSFYFQGIQYLDVEDLQRGSWSVSMQLLVAAVL